MDGIDESSPHNDHFPANVTLTLTVVVQNGERRRPRCAPWEEDHSFAVRTPDVLFSTALERDETIDNFGEFSQLTAYVTVTVMVMNCDTYSGPLRPLGGSPLYITVTSFPFLRIVV